MTGHSDAAQWLSQALDDFEGEVVIVRRGPLETEVRAIRATNSPKLMSDDGQAFIELKGQEWLIQPSHYEFDEQASYPLPGDRIVVGSETFVVSPLFGSQPCWRWSNQIRTYLRIYTELG